MRARRVLAVLGLLGVFPMLGRDAVAQRFDLSWYTIDGGGTSGGGSSTNTASGLRSTVPGGLSNTACGDDSFAAGRHAKANHTGAFVWGDDSTGADVASSANNQFIVRASGGMWFGTTSSPSIPAGRFLNSSTGGYLTTGGVWTNASDRESKENFQALDSREMLDRLAAVPIARWNYKAEGESIQHIGPTAQDFHAAFGVGDSDKSITAIDADGVALAAIQGLYEVVNEKDARVVEQQRTLVEQQRTIDELRARLDRLERAVLKVAEANERGVGE
jgi:hypothetical protein